MNLLHQCQTDDGYFCVFLLLLVSKLTHTTILETSGILRKLIYTPLLFFYSSFKPRRRFEKKIYGSLEPGKVRACHQECFCIFTELQIDLLVSDFYKERKHRRNKENHKIEEAIDNEGENTAKRVRSNNFHRHRLRVPQDINIYIKLHSSALVLLFEEKLRNQWSYVIYSSVIQSNTILSIYGTHKMIILQFQQGAVGISMIQQSSAQKHGKPEIHGHSTSNVAVLKFRLTGWKLRGPSNKLWECK